MSRLHATQSCPYRPITAVALCVETKLVILLVVWALLWALLVVSAMPLGMQWRFKTSFTGCGVSLAFQTDESGAERQSGSLLPHTAGDALSFSLRVASDGFKRISWRRGPLDPFKNLCNSFPSCFALQEHTSHK